MKVLYPYCACGRLTDASGCLTCQQLPNRCSCGPIEEKAMLDKDSTPPASVKVVIRAALTDDWVGVAYVKDYAGDPSTIHEYVPRADMDARVAEKDVETRKLIAYFEDKIASYRAEYKRAVVSLESQLAAKEAEVTKLQVQLDT